MFTLDGPAAVENARLEITVGDASFVLIARPVSDDERTTDSALINRHYTEEDVKEAGKWYLARGELRLSCVIGWEGIFDKSEPPKPVPFTLPTMKRLLGVEECRAPIIAAINAHFDKRVSMVRLGESKPTPTGSLPESAAKTTASNPSSDGSSGGDGQAG